MADDSPASPGPPGWYADPWTPGGWRWYDGTQWTANVGSNQEQQPRLPAWLSVPVAAFGLITVPAVVYLASLAPQALVFGLVPIVIVLPVLVWFDRVEPEPWSSRIHAFLWGAVVATAVSAAVNSLVEYTLGTVPAVVISAPLIEETMKGLGILWAVRRREVDSVMDGVIYAGWVALGFAVVEDVAYFVSADAAGMFWSVFFIRAVLTPFVHPLFSCWMGLAIGITVAKQEPLKNLRVLGGWLVAVACHGFWNGSLVGAEVARSSRFLLVAGLCFLVLFTTSLVALGRVRRRERYQFSQLAPYLADRYGLTEAEVAPFTQWHTMLKTRRALPRQARRDFDAVHSALGRLAAVYGREGGFDQATEARLHAQLTHAIIRVRASAVGT